MEDSRGPLNYCLDSLSFGQMTDTPNINFIPTIDLDHSIFHIPYTQPNITIQQLLEEYRSNTQCLKRYKHYPYLRIEQGERLNQLAEPDETLESLALDQSEICFHLVDLPPK